MNKLIWIFAVSCHLAFAADKPKLSDYKKIVYSQWGEDGIIEKIFQIIGITSKIAVEFGASDGFLYSNTANLWAKDPSWTGILIESNPSLFEKLVHNTKSYSCTPIHRKVEIGSKDGLEAILKEFDIPNSIDLLSIDIDGNDYYIFQDLSYLRPRVIICEYNPTLPAHLDIYPDYNNYLGCSVAALQRIARTKGYSLVAITDSNCFFIIDEEFHKFSEYETDRDRLKTDKYIRYLATDYYGNYKIVTSKEFENPYGLNRPSQENFRGEINVLSKDP